jgi:ribonuclease HII
VTQPNFAFENQYKGIVAGIDEVGCGPWAGPVVAAAVIIDQRLFPEKFAETINDSKKLSKKRRESLYQQLIQHPCLTYHIGSSSVEEIDQLNISRATKLAMKRAVSGLGVIPDHVLIDGVRDPGLGFCTQLIVKGDQKSFSIAAASIIAKVNRDEMMSQLHQDFPFFGWDKNVGYGTLVHRQGLQQHGVTVHHRRSFAPIRNLLEQL